MNKVVVFNGPPNSGKDVAAKFVVDTLNFQGVNSYHKEVKENLFKATKTCFGISDKVWEELYTRENKELPSYYLINNGENISPRNALINTSENVLKPLFGKDVFGIMAANSLEEGVNIFSDGGFKEEVLVLEEKVGKGNLLLIHLSRDGCTFEGDSRNYVEGFHPTVKINNNKSYEDFLEECYTTVDDWLKGRLYAKEKEY